MGRPPRFSDVCVQVLASGSAVRFTATGSSMRPAILDGDVLTVAPAEASDLAPGDVVLFRDGRRVVAHRVVGHEVDPPALLTRGDACGQGVETVPAVGVLGKVVRVERRGPVARASRRLACAVRRAFAPGSAGDRGRRPDAEGPQSGQGAPAGASSSIEKPLACSEFPAPPTGERELLAFRPDECV